MDAWACEDLLEDPELDLDTDGPLGAALDSVGSGQIRSGSVYRRKKVRTFSRNAQEKF